MLKNNVLNNGPVDVLIRGCAEIIAPLEFEALMRAGKPLKIKAGFDPTAPDLHLGHSLLLNKLKLFQEMGHHIYFLIGDFTARIGDPTGRDLTRQPLRDEDIQNNAKTYTEQVYQILDPARTQIVFNADWLGKKTAADMIRLASLQTVARMLERDDFHKRWIEKRPIAIHEFLYPLLQGYDSVELQADIELGGTDQKFNLLMGRELQRHFDQKPQVVMTLPLLEGLDGVRKMSKSYGNYIGLRESPTDMFGKLMSVSDVLMWRYFDLLSFQSTAEIGKRKKAVAEGFNPRDIKMELAFEITARFYGTGEAERVQGEFVARVSERVRPSDTEMIQLEHCIDGDCLSVGVLLKNIGLVQSTAQGLRLMAQGAVRIDNEKVVDPKTLLNAGEIYVLQVGKREFRRVCLKKENKN